MKMHISQVTSDFSMFFVFLLYIPCFHSRNITTEDHLLSIYHIEQLSLTIGATGPEGLLRLQPPPRSGRGRSQRPRGLGPVPGTRVLGAGSTVPQSEDCSVFRGAVADAAFLPSCDDLFISCTVYAGDSLVHRSILKYSTSSLAIRSLLRSLRRTFACSFMTSRRPTPSLRNSLSSSVLQILKCHRFVDHLTAHWQQYAL